MSSSGGNDKIQLYDLFVKQLMAAAPNYRLLWSSFVRDYNKMYYPGVILVGGNIERLVNEGLYKQFANVIKSIHKAADPVTDPPGGFKQLQWAYRCFDGVNSWLVHIDFLTFLEQQTKLKTKRKQRDGTTSHIGEMEYYFNQMHYPKRITPLALPAPSFDDSADGYDDC